MLKKILIGLLVLLGLGGALVAYIAFIHKPDTTAATNYLIQAAMDKKDKAEALQVIEVEYAQRQQLPELKRFWTLYVDSCEEGQCLPVATLVDASGYGEKAAYAAVCQETRKRLKAPASAKFEEKQGLAAKGDPGQLYSFSYSVDAENSFGAIMRMDCTATVQNVGEHHWYIGNLNCTQR